MKNQRIRFTHVAMAVLAAGGYARAADAVSDAVPSKVSAVTVYADRAVVTRTTELNLAAGTREIRLDRLPAALLDQSLQVSGRGPANATILDVSASQTFVEATPNERIKALQDEAKGVTKQLTDVSSRSAILDGQRDFVNRMLVASTTAAPASPGTPGSATRPTLDEWQKLYSYSDETLTHIATEITSLNEQRETLEAKKAAIDGQIAEMRGDAGRSYKSISVRLDAAQAGALQLRISYTVPNASWEPAYDARVRTAEKAVELSYFGVVRQSTGEDWDDVALTLSTAKPSLGGSAPALPPWVVDVAKPAGTPVAYSTINKDFMQTLGVTNMTEAGSWATGQTFYSTDNGGHGVIAGRNAPAETAAEFATASVDTGTTSATFKIAAPVSLPSNNTSRRVAITTLKLDSALRYESTPKMREAAYLAAPAKNTSDYPLLGGAMNTFLDDNYIATGAMTLAMPGEPFDLALGVDEGIGIKRRVVNRFAEDTGLGNKGRRVTYEILITVTNFKTTPEQVRFREPVPVSRDEKIVVRLLTPQERDVGTPANIREVIRENDGKLTWRLNLKPGEKRDVPLKFSVEYPADVTPVGLE